jgi:hypothetical protein
MKFLKSLLGKKEVATTPTWDIKPQGNLPAPKPKDDQAKLETPAKTTKTKKEVNPFLDDPALDTMSFEKEAGPDDNPYATFTWEQDPENDTRKMRTIQIGEKTEKKTSGDFDPYDTGKMRRGWKG